MLSTTCPSFPTPGPSRFRGRRALGTSAIRCLAWLPLIPLSLGGCGEGPVASSARDAGEYVGFTRVALVDSIAEKVYKALTKPAVLPPQLQCMERPKMSAREEADYTVHLVPSCFGSVVREFSFSFRVNPPRQGFKLKDGGLVFVKHGPKVQVLVYGPAKKAVGVAATHAKMFLQLHKIEGARAKELAKDNAKAAAFKK